MRIKSVFLTITSIFLFGTFAVSAQDGSTAKKQQTAVGTAKTIGQEKIVLETQNGSVDAILTKSTQFFRLPPDNLKLSAATESKLADITAGDRVLVSGTLSENNKDIFAVKVYLVKGTDIAQQQAKQIQEWRTRGISGRVTEVDTEAKLITVEMRGITGAATTLKVSPKDEIKFLRYSPESVKYTDALKSDFTEIQPGDMIQALGDRSEDGTSFKAEEILTGSFVTVAGNVKSVDAAKNEVTITDLKTKQDVTISVNGNSLLKKFPEEDAQRMARLMGMMQAGGGGGRPPQGGQGNQAGPGGGMGRMNINDMLNRFPTISVADLKAGEMIAVSSPKGKDETRLTAIKLLAGVEPFITLASMSGGRNGGGRGGVSGGLNIPGLDSIEF
jgi:hypothetical protein